MRTKFVMAMVTLALLSTVVFIGGVVDASVASDTLVDPAGGGSPSMVLNPAGNPVISYHEDANSNLRVVECGDLGCTSGNSINTVDTDNAGFQSSITLNGSGHPVVSYHTDETFGSLRVVECGSTDCSTGNSINTVEQGSQGGTFGYWSTIAISPSSGLPIVSYNINATDPDLGVRSCTTSDCATSTLQIPDLLGSVGEVASMVIDPAGFPVIAYRAPAAGNSAELRLMRCGSVDCSTGNWIRVIDTGAFVGAEVELALDTVTNANGVPVMVYSNTDSLWLARCTDSACTSSTVTSLFGGARMGWNTGLALDNQANPVIAYQNFGVGIRLAHCADLTCSSATDQQVSAAGAFSQPDLVLTNAGDAVVAYTGHGANSTLHVAVVSDCTAVTLVADEAELQQAVDCYNRQVPAGNHAIVLSNDIALASGVNQINQNDPSISLEIQGDGYHLSGPGSGGIAQVLSVNGAGPVAIHNLELSGSDDWGIGISATSTRVDIINSVIHDNSDGIIMLGGDLVVRNSEIYGNSQKGIFAAQGVSNTVVSNSTVHGNGDDGVNGGSASVVLGNSTVMNNGSGIVNAELISSLVVGNGTNCVGATNSGFNADDDGTCGGLTVTASTVDTPSDNGCQQALSSGCARTAALTPASEAIDSGTCTNLPVELSSGTVVTGTVDVDQRYEARPQGVTCDIGAYESSRVCTLNDDFECALGILPSPLPQTVSGSNLTATKQGGESNPTCTSVFATLWWEWTPTTSEVVQIDTAGSNFDTVLGIWTGSDLTSIAQQSCNDDAINVQSKLQLGVNAGTTYFIQVGSWGRGRGDVTVNISTVVDTDGDGVTDDLDNCPNDWNPLQGDTDGDGNGDICDLPPGVTITPGPTVLLTYTGCPGDVITVTVNDLLGSQVFTGQMVENPTGVHTLSLARASVPQGAYEVVFSGGCGTISTTTGIGYFDPSGIIYNQIDEPIEAEVTLLYSSTKITDPYDAALQVVPDGSLIMSPDNRQNPVQTEAGVGYYGWDTIPGWFVVKATAPGCTSLADPTSTEVRSDVLPVLPEHFDVDLYFECELPCEADNQFADVPEDRFYTEAVAWAACEGITTGTSTTTFSPSATVTRAQWATFLWRYAGEPTGFTHDFDDVQSPSYYEDAVAWMADGGITTGTSDTTFSPNAPVTRAQLATFLWRYAGEPTGFSHPFTDVVPGSFYEDGVAWMATTGVTTGTSDTTYSPRQPLTRAQAVTFLHRYSMLIPA